MPLTPQTQRLETEQELVSGERAQRGAEVSQNLDPASDSKGDWAEGFPELEAVIALRRVVHLWETLCILAPVKLPTVNDDATDRCAMTTNPFGGGMNDYVCPVLYRPAEIAARAKCIVDLSDVSLSRS